MEVGQAHGLGVEPVEMGRVNRLVTVAAGSECRLIVGEKEDDVRGAGRRRSVCRPYACGFVPLRG